MIKLTTWVPVLAMGAAAAVLFAGCGSSAPVDGDGGPGGASGNDDGNASGGGTGGSTEAPDRVVGYLPTYRSLSPTSLNFDTMTHLCIAFANPTGVGSESDFDEGVRSQIAPLVAAAHDKNVKVLASIAGGTEEAGALVGAQIAPDNVDAYVGALLDLVDRYELDGIDVDIEGNAVTGTYEPFVKKLSAALPADKLLTAAVATWNGDSFSSAALAEYDFINLMSYDHCGWSADACPHASLEATLEELDYWTVERAYPREKTVLGVPFYGWCWGCAAEQTAMTYAQIVAQYPAARTDDWIEDGAVTISLNSATTIATKAELALDYGGVMVWELGQDAVGDDSLFRVIAAAQP